MRDTTEHPRRLLPWLVLAPVLVAGACGGERTDGDGLTGNVAIDGSSTVYPITAAVVEDFQRAHPRTRVTVGISGTGGGFQKFCAGETHISNASREIGPTELEACREAGVDPVEILVARDGLTVAVNPANEWAECVTAEELRRLWQPGSTIERWSQIRSEWPDTEIALTRTTFDYFTEAIVGEENASRSDYTASADDNVLVRGVAGDRAALGYFGFAYYEENRDGLKALEIDGGEGCVAPTRENIESGAYEPLSRPLYLYVRDAALRDTTVRRFLGYYLESAPELVPQVGYVALDAEAYEATLGRLAEGTLGSPGGG